MDEPTAALTESDVTRLFDIVRRLKSRGVGIVYISHRLDELFEIADRVTVLRDGAYVGAREVADTNAAELVQMMVGRRIENLFPKSSVPIGAPVLQARGLVCHPMTRNVSLDVRAGEIVGLAGLVGSGRSELAQVLFGITPAEQGEIRLLDKTVKVHSPEIARSQGIAYVPEDRGVQGLVRPMSVLHNFSLAGLGALSRLGFIDRAAERRLAEAGVQRFSVKTSSVEEVGGPPFRRQSAKDRARQVARQQSEAPHPRRADPRHRCRRQGGDPSPDVRARRGGRRDPDDLERAARGSGHERPGAGDARGAAGRRVRPRARDLGGGRRRDDGLGRDHGAGGVSAIPIAIAAMPRASVLRRFASQEALLAVAVIGLAIAVGFVNPRFLAYRNLADILLGNAYIAIAAIGMSMVIISGNIDISVGALIGVLATLSGSLAVAGAPTIVTWLAPLVLGVAVMAAQGAIVAYLRIPRSS